MRCKIRIPELPRRRTAWLRCLRWPSGPPKFKPELECEELWRPKIGERKRTMRSGRWDVRGRTYTSWAEWMDVLHHSHREGSKEGRKAQALSARVVSRLCSSQGSPPRCTVDILSNGDRRWMAGLAGNLLLLVSYQVFVVYLNTKSNSYGNSIHSI